MNRRSFGVTNRRVQHHLGLKNLEQAKSIAHWRSDTFELRRIGATPFPARPEVVYSAQTKQNL